MTGRRDSKSKPKRERPKLDKQKLKDLDAEPDAARVKGGAANECPPSGTYSCRK